LLLFHHNKAKSNKNTLQEFYLHCFQKSLYLILCYSSDSYNIFCL